MKCFLSHRQCHTSDSSLRGHWVTEMRSRWLVTTSQTFVSMGAFSHWAGGAGILNKSARNSICSSLLYECLFVMAVNRLFQKSISLTLLILRHWKHLSATARLFAFGSLALCYNSRHAAKVNLWTNNEASNHPLRTEFVEGTKMVISLKTKKGVAAWGLSKHYSRDFVLFFFL